MRLSSLGNLHQEDKSPEDLAFKASGAYFQESQRAVGNRDFILKSLILNLRIRVLNLRTSFLNSHMLGNKGRTSNLKEAWVRPSC